MLRRSLSFVVCFSLLACGNLMAMEKTTTVKKTVSVENKVAEKLKSSESLKEKTANTEKIITQIQAKFVAEMDKDVAANICIRNLKKAFESLSEPVRYKMSAYFEEQYDILWAKYNERLIRMSDIAGFINEEKGGISEYMQKTLADKAVSVTSKHAKDFDSVICASILDSEIGSNLINIFLGTCRKSIQQKIEIEEISPLTILDAAAALNHCLLAFKDSVKIGIQAMANELSKHYKIDFEELDLEAPEAPANAEEKDNK